MQELIYNLNVPSRWGTQTPFTNLTFDWTCPDDLRDQVPVIGGEEMGFTYGDLQAEMDLINRAYIEVMTQGDAKGRVFTFPIPTYNITPDFPLGERERGALFEMTAKYGLPYFQNFINSELKPNMVRSMCCRCSWTCANCSSAATACSAAPSRPAPGRGDHQLRASGLSACRRRGRAVPRLDACWNWAAQPGDQAQGHPAAHGQGLFPYTKRYLGTLRNHFSTLGVNGINEMIRNFTGDAPTTSPPPGATRSPALLDHVRERIVQPFRRDRPPLQPGGHARRGHDLPLRQGRPEALPRHPAGRHGRQPYYTNSSQLPVGFTDDPFEALSARRRCSANTPAAPCCTCTWASACPACKKLVRRALENFRLPYVTVTPTFSICPKHGYVEGEHAFCPRCDAELRAEKRRAAAN
jgi:ribonucleoside-triphosphate reductase